VTEAGLHVLCCPSCGGDLTLTARDVASDGHVMEGTLACGGCASAFPIRRGIPRFAGELSGDVERTVDAFGFQWERANALLKDTRFSAPEVFLDFVRPVEGEWLRGTRVLDAGCGFGRFTLGALHFGAAIVVGVDLSDAVEVAFANTRHLPNALIVQADIFHLPVKQAFDYAFSVGVLHHTPDPRGAFLQVVSKVVPGGSVSAWVYGREHNGWIVHVANPIRRVTSRLPKPLLLAMSYVAAFPLFAVTHGVYGPLSRGASKASARRLFYFDYFVFLSQFGYREHAFVIFDHAAPAIAEYIRREAFAEWFEAAGLEQVVITMRGGNSWCGFGIRPQAARYI
jgi:SAM-dependent methyltransferase